LDVMKDIPDKSVDMICCDLPYGTTHNKWDSVIPFGELWCQYDRVCKNNAVIALTAQNLFSAKTIMSNENNYRYSLIWEKSKAGGFLNASRMPLQNHEDILIFYKSLPKYNPQMQAGNPYRKKAASNGDGGNYGIFERKGVIKINNGERFPLSIINFNNGNNKTYHPTQKPVALIEYLIRTYTDKGDTVLDNCVGSGTTAVACKNTHRNFIAIEKEPKYVEIAKRRVANAQPQLF